MDRAITISGSPDSVIKPGVITIAGVNELIPNPCRKWWQVWKPPVVDSGELKKFTVHG